MTYNGIRVKENHEEWYPKGHYQQHGQEQHLEEGNGNFNQNENVNPYKR